MIYVHAGAKKAGCDPVKSEIIVGPLCSVSMDRAAAISTMKQLLAIFMPFTSPMKEAHGIDEKSIEKANAAYLEGDHKKAESFVPDEPVRAFSLTGTPDDVIPQIEALIYAGARHIAYGPPMGLISMRPYGSWVRKCFHIFADVC